MDIVQELLMLLGKLYYEKERVLTEVAKLQARIVELEAEAVDNAASDSTEGDVDES